MISVFDGVPRTKQQIDATSGALLGESERDGERNYEKTIRNLQEYQFSLLLGFKKFANKAIKNLL